MFKYKLETLVEEKAAATKRFLLSCVCVLSSDCKTFILFLTNKFKDAFCYKCFSCYITFKMLFSFFSPHL